MITFFVWEIIAYHWNIRKTYQTSLYRFNSYHELNLMVKEHFIFTILLEKLRLYTYSYIQFFKLTKIFIPIIDYLTTLYWYNHCWFYWVILTHSLYYNVQVRDLGPSYEILDYNPDINMGLYKTIGPFLLLSWMLWTFTANSVFIDSIFYFLNKFFWEFFTKRYWYNMTLYSCIEMYFIIFLKTWYETNEFIFNNYLELFQVARSYNSYNRNMSNLNWSTIFIFENYKSIFVWFPWHSFFNYLTIFGILYVLTLVSIYNTDNLYYNVLYMIFLIFLFASNLIILDLDIFAGLLLLIESVVVLMLFFLIIYLTPNVQTNIKVQKWKLYSLLFIILSVLSIYSYINLGSFFFNTFSVNALFLDDFYELLNESFVNDLTGIFISLYITNSILLVVIGLLLLIASIICVVLVSFFTKLRNINFNLYLNIFDIAKTCYTFIFLRKQNLSKQGRSITSTRIFKKKNLNNTTHTEYKEKYNNTGHNENTIK